MYDTKETLLIERSQFLPNKISWIRALNKNPRKVGVEKCETESS